MPGEFLKTFDAFAFSGFDRRVRPNVDVRVPHRAVIVAVAFVVVGVNRKDVDRVGQVAIQDGRVKPLAVGTGKTRFSVSQRGKAQ